MTVDSQTSVLETLLEHACQKVQVTKENEICKYLNDGKGRLHHFTFEKMKQDAPEKLCEMVKEQIIENHAPSLVMSKPRKKRESRKVTFKLNPDQMNKIAHALEVQGDKDLASLFKREPSVNEMKKMVLHSIKSGEPDKDLIKSYLNRLDKQSS